MNTDITNESTFSTTLGGQFAPGVGRPSGSATRSQTANQSIDSSVLGDPAVPGAIEFRVSRAGESRRRLRLTGNRYTFGNADGCTIRLNDPNLRPMHAVLIREGSRVITRSYSVPVQVNGVETNEATLRVGDILKLGLYEFELIGSSESSGPNSTSQDRTSTFGKNRAPSRRDLPATDEVIWRERLRREVDQWRQRQEDCDRRESRIDEREAELRSRESELWSRSDNLHRRETRVQSQETETFHLYDEFAQRQQELLRLQDESNERQEMLQRREIEFREQEFEYRRRLAEATAQLDQSKLQADSATQAVARMREQFDALNAQIEELSKDQQQIEAKEVQQTEEYQRVREELETAKIEAEQGRQESERQREEAEFRAAELAAEIEELKSNRGSDSDEQRAELEESKRVVEQLRDQVAELQKSVADASAESSQLRAEYEQSSAKVQELETLVSESQQRGDENRDEWAAEAEQLRAEVERLSGDLSAANYQLAEVREANDSLNARLSDLRQERDDACVERDARPTTAAFEALRNELDQANDQLTEIKRQYDQMLDKLDESSQSDAGKIDAGTPDSGAIDSGAIDSGAIDSGAIDSGAIPAAFGLAATVDVPESSDEHEIQSDGELVSESEPQAIISETMASEEYSDADDDDPWPTYQSTTITGQAPSDVEPTDAQPSDEPSAESVWQTSAPESQSNDDLVEVTNQWAAPHAEPEEEEVSSWQSTLDDELPSTLDNEDTSSEDAGPSYAWESTEVLKPTDENETDDVDDDVDSKPSNVWGSISDDSDATESDTDESDSADIDMSESVVSGSLASALIQDLDKDRVDDSYPVTENLVTDNAVSEAYESGQSPEEMHENTFVMGEDSDADSWSNDQESAVGQFRSTSESDDEPDDHANASPWDDVNERAHDFLDGSDDDDDEMEIPGVAKIETASEAAVAPASEPAEDDDSIEAYMNRLLRRVQGDSGLGEETAMPETISVSTSQSSVVSGSSISQSVGTDTSVTQSQPIDSDAPLVPRSQAPERASNLSAMRDLANSSARSAISRSARVQSRDTQIQAMVSFACAIGALACNAFAFYFVTGVFLIVAVAMTFVVAFICFREGMHLMGEARRRVQTADSDDQAHEADAAKQSNAV